MILTDQIDDAAYLLITIIQSIISNRDLFTNLTTTSWETRYVDRNLTSLSLPLPCTQFNHTHLRKFSSSSSSYTPKLLGFTCLLPTQSQSQSHSQMKNQSSRRTCELCQRAATVYCDSDSAFLCSTCDGHVHTANFLAARHVRIPICLLQYHEQEYDHTLVHGTSKEIDPSSPRVVCLSWTEPDDSDDHRSSSSSSSCVSSSESGDVGRHKRLKKTGISRRRRNLDFTRKLVARVELVVSDWCLRVLFGSLCASIRERVEAVARDIVRVGVRKMRNIPLKCVAAATVWMAVQMFSDGNAAAVRRRKTSPGGVLIGRLEKCSGVPAKIILLVETKLARVLEMCHVEGEEGSGECCSSIET